MDARGVQFGQVARDIATSAFHGASDTAVAFMQAAISWWDGLDPAVKRCVQFGAAVGGAAAAIIFTRLATVLIDASGIALLASASAEVAAGLAAIAAGMAVGAFMTAAALCANSMVPGQ
jgi:phage-related minor tail protein